MSPSLGLFAVCDGLGGHAIGEAAARLALKRIEWTIRSALDVVRGVDGGRRHPTELTKLVRDAVHAASESVYEAAARDPASGSAGCTVTAVLIAGATAAMAHCGNTRLFLLREGNIEQLSTVHKVAAEMVRRGLLSPEQARDHPASRSVTRCIGVQPSAEIETLYFEIRPGDRLFLCSDAIAHGVECLAEMAEFVAGVDLEDVPGEIARFARDRCAAENVSAVLVWFEARDGEQKQVRKLAADQSRELAALRRVSCFAGLGFADLLRVHGLAELRRCEPGHVVLSEQDTADHLCIVLEGLFALEAGEETLRKLWVGESIGETTLLVSRPCRTVLRARSAGEVLIVSGNDLRRLARRRPWFGADVLLRLAEKLSSELASVRDVVEHEVDHRSNGSLPRSVVSLLSRIRG